MSVIDLVVFTLAAPAGTATGTGPGPHLLTDILWANTRTADRIEHISVQPHPDEDCYTAALFLRADRAGRDAAAETSAETAARVCRSAITASPALAGWTARLDPAGLRLGD